MMRKMLLVPLLAAIPCIAQEKPVPPAKVVNVVVDAPEPGVHDVFINAPMVVATRTAPVEKITHLGVTTTPVPAAMSEQLKLPRGVGLVVNSVQPKTSGDEGGIKVHDVIEKLDDQWVVNHEQMSRLVKNHKEGDEVSLTILRKGERQTLKVKLKQSIPEQVNFTTFNLAIPPNAADHVLNLPTGAGGRRVLIKNIDGQQNTEWSDQAHRISIEKQGEAIKKVTITDVVSGKVVSTVDGDAARAREALAKTPELLEKFNQAEQAAQVQPLRIAFDPQGAIAAAPGFVAAPMAARGKVMTWSDDQHILVLRTMGNQPTYLLALSKKDGRVVFDGPVMSEEQRKGVPAQVAEQFEMVVNQPQMLREFGVSEKK